MPYYKLVATAGTSALHKDNVAGREVQDPMRVSAEYSVLHALRAKGRLGPKPLVVLVHSDTADGTSAVRLLQPLLERDFDARVELRPVAGLDADKPEEMRRSLGAFMHEVANALRDEDPISTCFAPLGGYKVMTSLAYLAGAFCGFPTAYLHEGNQVLHELPAVPLRIDETGLSEVAPAVRRALNGITYSALSAADRDRVEAYPWLFERTGAGADDLVALNAFGHFLRAEPKYRAVIGPRIRGVKAVEATCRREIRFVRKEVGDLLSKLERPLDHRGSLHHEADFGHHGAPWSLFKGASNREGVFRAVYRWDQAEDTLDLREVWLDHDEYERRAARVDTFRGDESVWAELGAVVLAG